MSSIATTTPDEAPSYFEQSLVYLLDQTSCTGTLRQDMNDGLTAMRPTETHTETKKQGQSRLRLIENNPDIYEDGKSLYTKHHARKMAARILSQAASKAEQSALDKHGVDYQTAYRLSGAPGDEVTLRNSTFASKTDKGDGYRLLKFDSQSKMAEKDIDEVGLRSRLQLPEGVKERERRRKVCGTSCSTIDGVTRWMQHQEGSFWTEPKDDIQSYRHASAVIRAILKLPGTSVGGARALEAKKRLWKSKYNHPELRQKDSTHRGLENGILEMLSGRLAAEIMLSREPDSATVKNLRSRWPDLSEAIYLDCDFNEGDCIAKRDPIIAQSRFFFPAEPETSQSVHPSDQFYDLASIVDGEIVSCVEHFVGSMVGMLGAAKRPAKPGSSKRSLDEEDGEAGSSNRSKARIV